MTRFTAFVIIVALRLIYQPSKQQHIPPFASPAPLPASTTLRPIQSLLLNTWVQQNSIILARSADKNRQTACPAVTETIQKI